MDKINERFEAALRREALSQNSEMPEPESLAPDAPAPRLEALVNEYGPGPCARALMAWQARMNGDSIIAIATDLGLSIPAAKDLISEVYAAIQEDLKENIDLNRQLDLARIDALIGAHFPRAQQGKTKSAQFILRCIERRSKLIGLEPMPAPSQHNSQSVLIWIQEKLPSIDAIVRALPPELPPSAPGN
jgi:hypothetical protein